MEIGRKLFIWFSLIILLVGAIGYVSVVTFGIVGENLGELEEHVVPDAFMALYELEHTANEIHLLTVEYMLEGRKRGELDDAMQRLTAAGARHAKYTEQTGYKTHPPGELEASIIKVNSVAAELANLKDQGVSIEELNKKERQELHPALDALTKEVERHIRGHVAELAGIEEDIFRAHSLGIEIILASSAAVVIMAILLSIFITRAISGPIRGLTATIEDISRGKLDVKVEGKERDDEIGDLARAFDRTLVSLKLAMKMTAPELKKRSEELKKALEEKEKALEDKNTAEKALRASEAKYRKIFELSPEAIVIADTDGNIVDINNRVYDWLGYKPEEIIGLNGLELPFNTKSSMVAFGKAIARRKLGLPLKPYTVELKARSGKLVRCRLIQTHVRDEKGKRMLDLIMVSKLGESGYPLKARAPLDVLRGPQKTKKEGKRKKAQG
jgi:PAS domain S-box-containing protein